MILYFLYPTLVYSCEPWKTIFYLFHLFSELTTITNMNLIWEWAKGHYSLHVSVVLFACFANRLQNCFLALWVVLQTETTHVLAISGGWFFSGTSSRRAWSFTDFFTWTSCAAAQPRVRIGVKTNLRPGQSSRRGAAAGQRGRRGAAVISRALAPPHIRNGSRKKARWLAHFLTAYKMIRLWVIPCGAYTYKKPFTVSILQKVVQRCCAITPRRGWNIHRDRSRSELDRRNTARGRQRSCPVSQRLPSFQNCVSESRWMALLTWLDLKGAPGI
jgi:hypothetical protein